MSTLATDVGRLLVATSLLTGLSGVHGYQNHLGFSYTSVTNCSTPQQLGGPGTCEPFLGSLRYSNVVCEQDGDSASFWTLRIYTDPACTALAFGAASFLEGTGDSQCVVDVFPGGLSFSAMIDCGSTDSPTTTSPTLSTTSPTTTSPTVTTAAPVTDVPTTAAPTTTTSAPSTQAPTLTTQAPTLTTQAPTVAPTSTTDAPTEGPSAAPTTAGPTTTTLSPSIPVTGSPSATTAAPSHSPTAPTQSTDSPTAAPTYAVPNRTECPDGYSWIGQYILTGYVTVPSFAIPLTANYTLALEDQLAGGGARRRLLAQGPAGRELLGFFDDVFGAIVSTARRIPIIGGIVEAISPKEEVDDELRAEIAQQREDLRNASALLLELQQKQQVNAQDIADIGLAINQIQLSVQAIGDQVTEEIGSILATANARRRATTRALLLAEDGIADVILDTISARQYARRNVVLGRHLFLLNEALGNPRVRKFYEVNTILEEMGRLADIPDMRGGELVLYFYKPLLDYHDGELETPAFFFEGQPTYFGQVCRMTVEAVRMPGFLITGDELQTFFTESTPECYGVNARQCLFTQNFGVCEPGGFPGWDAQQSDCSVDPPVGSRAPALQASITRLCLKDQQLQPECDTEECDPRHLFFQQKNYASPNTTRARELDLGFFYNGSAYRQCTSRNACVEGQGHCEHDTDCRGGNRCGVVNSCPWSLGTPATSSPTAAPVSCNVDAPDVIYDKSHSALHADLVRTTPDNDPYALHVIYNPSDSQCPGGTGGGGCTRIGVKFADTITELYQFLAYTEPGNGFLPYGTVAAVELRVNTTAYDQYRVSFEAHFDEFTPGGGACSLFVNGVRVRRVDGAGELDTPISKKFYCFDNEGPRVETVIRISCSAQVAYINRIRVTGVALVGTPPAGPGQDRCCESVETPQCFSYDSQFAAQLHTLDAALDPITEFPPGVPRFNDCCGATRRGRLGYPDPEPAVKCGIGEGQCMADEDCAGSLLCGYNNCGANRLCRNASCPLSETCPWVTCPDWGPGDFQFPGAPALSDTLGLPCGGDGCETVPFRCCYDPVVSPPCDPSSTTKLCDPFTDVLGDGLAIITGELLSAPATPDYPYEFREPLVSYGLLPQASTGVLSTRYGTVYPDPMAINADVRPGAQPNQTEEHRRLWESSNGRDVLAALQYGPDIELPIGRRTYNGETRVLDPGYAQESELVLNFAGGVQGIGGYARDPDTCTADESPSGQRVLLCCRPRQSFPGLINSSIDVVTLDGLEDARLEIEDTISLADLAVINAQNNISSLSAAIATLAAIVEPAVNRTELDAILAGLQELETNFTVKANASRERADELFDLSQQAEVLVNSIRNRSLLALSPNQHESFLVFAENLTELLLEKAGLEGGTVEQAGADYGDDIAGLLDEDLEAAVARELADKEGKSIAAIIMGSIALLLFIATIFMVLQVNRREKKAAPDNTTDDEQKETRALLEGVEEESTELITGKKQQAKKG